MFPFLRQPARRVFASDRSMNMIGSVEGGRFKFRITRRRLRLSVPCVVKKINSYLRLRNPRVTESQAPTSGSAGEGGLEERRMMWPTKSTTGIGNLGDFQRDWNTVPPFPLNETLFPGKNPPSPSHSEIYYVNKKIIFSCEEEIILLMTLSELEALLAVAFQEIYTYIRILRRPRLQQTVRT